MKRIIIILVVLSAALSIYFLNSSRMAKDKSLQGDMFFELKRVQEIFPEALDISASQKEEWSAATGKSGREVGYILTTKGYSDHVTGYAGPTPLLIGADEEGKIAGVIMLENGESPGFASDAASSGLLDAWDGLAWKDAAALEVDSITGATMTSRAVINTLRHRLSQVKGEELKGEAYSLYGDIFALILALIALFVCITMPKKHDLIRMIILVVSVIYLGLFRGEFLSTKLTLGWITGGVALKGTVALGVIAALSLALLIFKGKKLYCLYLCPFGALQELIYKALPWRVHISPGLYRSLEKIKTILLVIIALFLIFDVSIDLTTVEPFTVFLLRSAEKGVIIMALVTFLVSIFLYRPWCNFLCPTGALFELFNKKKSL